LFDTVRRSRAVECWKTVRGSG